MSHPSTPNPLWTSFGDNTRFLGILLVAIAAFLVFAVTFGTSTEEIASYHQKHSELTYEQASSQLADSTASCRNLAIGLGLVGGTLILIGYAIVRGFARWQILAYTLAAAAGYFTMVNVYRILEALSASDYGDAFCQALVGYILAHYAWDGVQLGIWNGERPQKETAARETISDAAVL